MIGNRHEKGDAQGHSRVSVSYEVIDLWTEVRYWSLRLVCTLRTASMQTRRTKLFSQLRPRLDVEISLVNTFFMNEPRDSQMAHARNAAII